MRNIFILLTEITFWVTWSVSFDHVVLGEAVLFLISHIKVFILAGTFFPDQLMIKSLEATSPALKALYKDFTENLPLFFFKSTGDSLPPVKQNSCLWLNLGSNRAKFPRQLTSKIQLKILLTCATDKSCSSHKQKRTGYLWIIGSLKARVSKTGCFCHF